MKTVGQFLEEKGGQLWTISQDAKVIEALHMMADKDIGAILVVQHNRLLGIFSERDYARKVVLEGRSSRDTSIGELMTEDVISVSLTDTLENCTELMTAMNIRHLPVLDVDKLVGILTLGDIAKHVLSDQKRKIHDLEEQSSGGE